MFATKFILVIHITVYIVNFPDFGVSSSPDPVTYFLGG